jgi:nucleoside-diphosphate-sugar epimerase
MKVLFFGSGGWIGKQLYDYLCENAPESKIIETNVRADNERLVNDIVLAHSPTHIVSAVGRICGEGYNTADYLEQEGKLVENVRDNLYAPMVLANVCAKYNIHLTYLGTGCIYNQENPNDHAYFEDDIPDFFGSSYSVVKGFTDRLMHLYPKTVLNLRIRMPVVNYDHHRNFITKIANYEKICSNPNSITVLSDMYPIILDMMSKKTTGTFNMTNPGLISHNEILEMYKELVKPSFEWTNFSIEEQNKILKSKRSNNYLDTSKLVALYPQVPNIKDSIKNCLSNYKQS